MAGVIAFHASCGINATPRYVFLHNLLLDNPVSKILICLDLCLKVFNDFQLLPHLLQVINASSDSHVQVHNQGLKLMTPLENILGQGQADRKRFFQFREEFFKTLDAKIPEHFLKQTINFLSFGPLKKCAVVEFEEFAVVNIGILEGSLDRGFSLIRKSCHNEDIFDNVFAKKLEDGIEIVSLHCIKTGVRRLHNKANSIQRVNTIFALKQVLEKPSSSLVRG